MPFKFFRQSSTIKKKLVLVIMGITLAVLMIEYIVQSITDYYALRAETTAKIEITADLAGKNVASALDFMDEQAAAQNLEALAYEESIFRACVYDVHGALFASNRHKDAKNGTGNCPDAYDNIGPVKSINDLHIIQPISLNGKHMGWIFIDYSLTKMHVGFIGKRLSAIMIMISALILAYILTTRLQKLITAPILRLTGVAEQLTNNQDYSIRAEKESDDEIGILVDAFNDMLSRIEKREGDLVKATQEADNANQLKGQFLATMSHEIRTPMNGILGMAELILGARPSLQIESYAQTIINSGESLQQIIDDILDFSKIEAGKLAIDPLPINMLDIADDVARLYAVKSRDKAIELAVRHVPGSEQFVHADPVRIRQILSNLISNAIKFTDIGHVAITINELKEGSNKETAMLKFSITDTGIGLSKEEQNRIFEKFSQADSSTTRKYGGTGLGLSICKSLTELMGGEIGVDSKKGEGTTFWLRIPFKRNTQEALETPTYDILKDIRILIVDDLMIIREMVKEQLRAKDIRCEDSTSGKEALEKMKRAYEEKDPYHIIIIDYLMPEMNGETLARAIKDDETLAKTCLIMLTAAGNPLADGKFSERGFSAYIPKPIEHHALISSIATVWSQYKAGKTNVLISIDTGRSLKRAHLEEEARASGEKVLVAEDNLVNQVFIKEILEEMEADYTIVSNGLEAVQAIGEEDYKLVLMDCLMPEMDGWAATQKIREMSDETKNSVPICALTANAMKGDREKCLESGMDDYLAKPVRKKELKSKVFSMIYGDDFEPEIPTQTSDAQAKGKPMKTRTQDDKTEVTNEDKTEPANTDILDLEAVQNARSILKGKYDDMVTIYITNSWEYVEEMTNAVQANDFEAIIRPAHTLKSTSKQMGAFKLSEIAKDIEHIAKTLANEKAEDDQSFKSIAKSIEEIKSLLSKTQKAFEDIAA